MEKRTLLTNNVIGPITPEDWLTLSMLKQSINFMLRKDRDKYRLNIKQEQEVYDYILGNYKTG